MAKRKEYSYNQINGAIGSYESGFTVREIAKRTKISKSVIGRWVKEPEKYRLKGEMNDAKRLGSPKTDKRMNSFWKKYNGKLTESQKNRLHVRRQVVDGHEINEYELYS